jgi:CheY-like chemotaxis protein
MKQRVLVVDDDAAVRQAIKPVLEGAGYEVLLSVDGQDAVTRFAAEKFDLMILDLSMPVLGGWDVFERLTTLYPLVPAIIITGLPDQYETAVAAGVGTLMEKPVDVPALLTTMDELLSEPTEKRLLRLSGRLNDTRHLRKASNGQFDGHPKANAQ